MAHLTQDYYQSTHAGTEVVKGTKNGRFLPRFDLSEVVVNFDAFALPPLSEQHAIIQKVSTLLACCDELEQQVRQSRSDLDVLMQAVLGEVFGAGAGGRGTGHKKTPGG